MIQEHSRSQYAVVFVFFGGPKRLFIGCPDLMSTEKNAEHCVLYTKLPIQNTVHVYNDDDDDLPRLLLLMLEEVIQKCRRDTHLRDTSL